uniref:Ig-like domain-containing protein n=1 Tax=Timema bartmani TaxID=61472 RepID=A0A7R9F082_9NEOP|nr:unnamed protein product [Timema bartmani]
MEDEVEEWTIPHRYAGIGDKIIELAEAWGKNDICKENDKTKKDRNRKRARKREPKDGVSLPIELTKLSFRNNKNRWIMETVDGASYRTGLAEKSYVWMNRWIMETVDGASYRTGLAEESYNDLRKSVSRSNEPCLHPYSPTITSYYLFRHAATEAGIQPHDVVVSVPGYGPGGPGFNSRLEEQDMDCLTGKPMPIFVRGRLYDLLYNTSQLAALNELLPTLETSRNATSVINPRSLCRSYSWGESSRVWRKQEDGKMADPSFEMTDTSITALVGQTVYLPCRVNNLGDKVASDEEERNSKESPEMGYTKQRVNGAYKRRYKDAMSASHSQDK